MLIRDILNRKGKDVIQVTPDDTVDAAVRRMVEGKVGSTIVVIDGKPQGMFTERDLLRIAASGQQNFTEVKIKDVMSTDIVVGLPSDSIEDVMSVMTERRCRHMPVLDEGKLIGMVSIGDLVKARNRDQKSEIHFLKNYIQGY